MKKCKKCGVVKPTSDFYLAERTKDGFRAECKECLKIQHRQDYLDRRSGASLEKKQAKAAAKAKREQAAIREKKQNEHLRKCPRCGKIEPIKVHYTGGGYYRKNCKRGCSLENDTCSNANAKTLISQALDISDVSYTTGKRLFENSEMAGGCA